MYKKWMVFCVAVLTVLSLFGCAEDPTGTSVKTELWVVTEQTTWDRMNGLAEVLIQEFEQTHKNATVRLDVLPTEEQERSVYLQQLRTQIMEGGGPDAYLLPTDGSLILDEPVQYTYKEVDLLFEDVELAMRNGLFYDISGFYDRDTSLGKEALHQQIMDAGVVDGARYVLPMRFDMPVIFADRQAIQGAGLDPEVLAQEFNQIITAVIALDDPVLAHSVLYGSYDIFGELIDYEAGEVLLDEETLSSYLKQYQQLRESIGLKVVNADEINNYDDYKWLIDKNIAVLLALELQSYMSGFYDEDITFVFPVEDSSQTDQDVVVDEFTGEAYIQKSFRYTLPPLHIGTIEDVLEYAPKAAYEQQDLMMVPFRAVNGDTVATVTYYGAVGSGCEDPELAYEFLRLFLLEESQFELNRPERSLAVGDKGRPLNTSNALQYPGMIEKGWPVRIKGSVEHMWHTRRLQFYNRHTAGITRMIGLIQLEDADIPVLDARIDRVRFNSELSESLADAVRTLNDPEREYTATDVDIDLLAEDLLWQLRWHVSEG